MHTHDVEQDTRILRQYVSQAATQPYRQEDIAAAVQGYRAVRAREAQMPKRSPQGRYPRGYRIGSV